MAVFHLVLLLSLFRDDGCVPPCSVTQSIQRWWLFSTLFCYSVYSEMMAVFHLVLLLSLFRDDGCVPPCSVTQSIQRWWLCSTLFWYSVYSEMMAVFYLVLLLSLFRDDGCVPPWIFANCSLQHQHPPYLIPGKWNRPPFDKLLERSW
jgi:hypothetical protein